ncbi:hypothetical protein RR46_11511 [Papilio xuthus]|uniref:Uncharacterized protein n=1 Tax=Papilio xuthus TaxID=66420 RepID=A0A194PS57_PAPXU|nr:hypothetical protein RR46_11511 [Papilio xuthus]
MAHESAGGAGGGAGAGSPHAASPPHAPRLPHDTSFHHQIMQDFSYYRKLETDREVRSGRVCAHKHFWTLNKLLTLVLDVHLEYSGARHAALPRALCAAARRPSLAARCRAHSDARHFLHLTKIMYAPEIYGDASFPVSPAPSASS